MAGVGQVAGHSLRSVLALLSGGGGQLADLRRLDQGDVLRRGDRSDQLLQRIHLRRRRAGGGARVHGELRHELHRDYRAELFLREGGEGLVRRDLWYTESIL